MPPEIKPTAPPGEAGVPGQFDLDKFLAEHGSEKVQIQADGKPQETTIADVFKKHAPGGWNYTQRAQKLTPLEDLIKKYGDDPVKIRQAMNKEFFLGDFQNWLQSDEGVNWIKGKITALEKQPIKTQEQIDELDQMITAAEAENPEQAKVLKSMKARMVKLEQDVDGKVESKLKEREDKDEAAQVASEIMALRKKYPDITPRDINRVKALAQAEIDTAVEEGLIEPGQFSPSSLLEIYEANPQLFNPVDVEKLKAETKAATLEELQKGKEKTHIASSGAVTTDEVLPTTDEEAYQRMLEKHGIKFNPLSTWHSRKPKT